MRETDREAGSNKVVPRHLSLIMYVMFSLQGISNKPINLKVFSPHVLDLTVVDLPGLTKVAVGDQPDDIEQQIKEMLYTYITQENTIILAVTPANQDLANSDALKLARKVDPKGDRTIGVITKLDLMDAGTDARSILENKFLPLQKGYVGVVNRSQKDIDTRKDIKEALAAERDFFLNSPYKGMANKMGTKFLQQTLNKELKNHIRNKLPEIKAEILKRKREVEEDLKNLGYDESTQESSSMLFKMLILFSDSLSENIDGTNSGQYVNVSEITGGALINRAFYHDFNSIYENSAPGDREISIAVANAHGLRSALFIPEEAFDKIIMDLMEKYKVSISGCVGHIRKLLDNILDDSLRVIEKYPNLKAEAMMLITNKLGENEKETIQQLETHIDAQKAFMNTRHPDFTSFRNNLNRIAHDNDQEGADPSLMTGINQIFLLLKTIIDLYCL